MAQTRYDALISDNNFLTLRNEFPWQGKNYVLQNWNIIIIIINIILRERSEKIALQGLPKEARKASQG